MGTLGLVIVGLVLALFLGYVCAVFPLAFSSKLAVLVLGGTFIVWAAASAMTARADNAGGAARASINIMAFLIGAFPNYLPFKFGPLPGVNPHRIAFAAVLMTGIYTLIASRQARASLTRNLSNALLPFCLLMAFLIWQFLTAVIGQEPIFSVYYVLKNVIPPLSILIVALACVRDWRDIQRTAVFLLLGAAITCIAGLIEWRTHLNVFLKYFPVSSTDEAGLEWILADKSRGGDYRVSATFGHPLLLAEFLCMVLPLVLMLAARAVERSSRILAWLMLPAMAAMIYLSYTRSSLIAALSSVIVMTLVFGVRFGSNRKRPGLAMFGWLAVVGALTVGAILSGSAAYLAKGRTEGETGSSQARLLMLERGKAVLEARPVQGYGPGMAAVKIGRLPGARGLTIDSYFLSVALESGYVGLALFSSAMLMVVLRGMRAGIRTLGTPSWSLIALSTGILASLIVKLVLSLTDNFELLYLLIGLTLVGLRLASDAKKTSDVKPTRQFKVAEPALVAQAP